MSLKLQQSYMQRYLHPGPNLGNDISLTSALFHFTSVSEKDEISQNVPEKLRCEWQCHLRAPSTGPTPFLPFRSGVPPILPQLRSLEWKRWLYHYNA